MRVFSFMKPIELQAGACGFRKGRLHDMPSGTPGHDDHGTGAALSGLAALRCIFGGILMGLANLVPGISGGTMLLAVGIYRLMIESIANLASFRSLLRSGFVLILVVLPAVLAIVALSGFAGRFVLEHRWIAFSLFIGLTLGGIPVLLRSTGRPTPMIMLGCLVGIALMAMLAFGGSGAVDAAGSSSILMLFVAGLAAGGAMLLPGLSGSYVLLILGQYVIVLTAIDELRSVLSSGVFGDLGGPLEVIVPVALGVLLGIALVGLVVRWLLARFRSLTLGVLLGLLVGALFGLWPFKTPVPPEVGSVVRGVTINSIEEAEAVKTKYWPTVGFTPTSAQFGGACALILLGAVVSGAIGLLGGDDEEVRAGSRSSSAEGV